MDGIIKNGENGFLCEEGNSSELVKILDSIFCLPLEKKEKISSLAIQTAKKYTDYNIALQYINLITDFKEWFVHNLVIFCHNNHSFLLNEINYASNIFDFVYVVTLKNE